MVSMKAIDDEKLIVIKCPEEVGLKYYLDVTSTLVEEEKKYAGYNLFIDLTDLKELNVNLAGFAEAINLYRSTRAYAGRIKMALLVPLAFMDTVKKVEEAVSEENYDQLVTDSIDECAAFLNVHKDVLLYSRTKKGHPVNSALDFIYSRRSIRKYLDKPVPENMVEDLLQAAMAAPSAVAKDPWHFIVVQQRQLLDQLMAVMPNAPMLDHAPMAIVVCGDINEAHDKLESYLLQDLSAAVENILLAASRLGLGACWLGIHPREQRMVGIREVFDLPEPIVPVAGIAVGWPSEQKPARTRYNPDRVHWNAW